MLLWGDPRTERGDQPTSFEVRLLPLLACCILIENVLWVLQDRLREWETNVGPITKTLHWSSNEFIVYVRNLFPLSSQERRKQFVFGSDLDDELLGVMDVAFAASCFMKSDIASMGQLFWIFAKELLRVYVSSTDELNFLLWGTLLPQTVLFLAPITFYMDCMIPPIETVMTIEGTVCADGSSPCTEVRLQSSECLIFRANTRITGIVFRRTGLRTSHANAPNTFLGFVGKKDAPVHVCLSLVQAFDGGLYFMKCGKVKLRGVAVSNAISGLMLDTVEEFVFNRFPGAETDTSFSDVGVFNCYNAFSLDGVKSVEMNGIRVRNVQNVFSGSVSDTFVMGTSCIDSCRSMGNLLVFSNIRPVFQSVLVS